MDSKHIALVTGSTSGIGLGIARTLASRGFNVILTGFGQDSEIASLLEDFKSNYDVQTDYVFADLSKPSDIDKMCVKVKGLYPDGIDVLINNAGLQHSASVEEFPVEKWDLMISVMLSAPFHLIQKTLPDMKKKGWGRIVNTASIVGLVGLELNAPYCSAKHGLIGLTKVVALESAGSGVTCNAICPGYVDTPLIQKALRGIVERKRCTPQEAKDILLRQQPLKEFIPIQQVADLVAYLCGDSASSITGSALNIDGGLLAQ